MIKKSVGGPKRSQTLASAIFPIITTLEPRRLMSAGQVDDGFSSDGVASFNLGNDTIIGNSNSFANAVAVQPDGKYVAVGFGSSTIGNRAKAARFNSNGTLDTSFASGGSLSVNFGGGAVNATFASAVGIQEDGKVLVAGTVTPIAAPPDVAITRLTSTGAVDTAWGSSGIRPVDFGGSETLVAMAIQSDGKVVVAASAAGNIGIARLTTTGAMDTTFSGDGKFVVSFGENVTAEDVAIQSDGAIVVAATTSNGDFAVARVLPNGTLDATFSGDGLTLVDFGADETCSGVELGNNGAIYLGGFSSTGAGATDIALARLTSTGALSTLFSSDGKALIDLGGAESASAIALRPDQSIIAGGNGEFVQVTQFGAIDQSWNNGGSFVNTTTSFIDNVSDIQLTPDGRVIVAGREGSDFAIGRLEDALETTFDNDGFARNDAAGGANFEFGQATAVLPDGRIYVGGNAAGIGDTDMFVMRYNANGSLDTTFSGDGKLAIELGGIDVLTDIALQADGKLVIAGHTDATGQSFVVVQRLNTDGTLDSTFGTAGVSTFNFSPSATAESRSSGIAIEPDTQRILIGGDVFTATSTDFAVARIRTNGTLDPAFSGDGIATLSFGDGDVSSDIAVAPDGKIVLVGTSEGVNPNFDNEFAIARFNSVGVLDTTFDADGRRLIDFGADTDDQAAGLAIDSAGRIVIVGSSGSSTALVRLLDTGANDNSFSTDGLLLLSATPSQQETNAVAVQADGRILLAGQRVTDQGTFGVIQRLTTTGGVDNSFGGEGVHMFSLGEGTDLAVINLTRGIVVAGSAGGLSTVAVINAGADLVADGEEFLFDTAPHRLTFQFNQNVSASLSGGDFTITRRDDNLAITSAQYSLGYAAATNTAIISFTNVFGGTVLADGNYRAVLSGMGVVGTNGLTLAGDREFNFFIFRGDANHDRIVNISDFAALAANFNQPGTFSQGNFDYSALVDISDFALLASRFNTSLPLPADLPRAPLAASVAMFSNTRIQETAADDLLDAIIA